MRLVLGQQTWPQVMAPENERTHTLTGQSCIHGRACILAEASPVPPCADREHAGPPAPGAELAAQRLPKPLSGEKSHCRVHALAAVKERVWMRVGISRLPKPREPCRRSETRRVS